jgi:Protein of unknown function (DUF3025)
VEYYPSFHRQHPLFWPIAPLVERLAGSDWPDAGLLSELFVGEAPVRFVRATPKPRQKRLSLTERYDARIALDGVVPTRTRSWHDLLNALVWVTFPRAKLALHTRQHRIIASRIGHDLRLPEARTPEQDAIAMFDEGGVVVLSHPSGRKTPAVFGHAIYEALVRGEPPLVRAAAVPVDVESSELPRAGLARADQALAAWFSQTEPITRADFEPLDVETRAIE